MTAANRAITEDMLHAYADGQLAAADRAAVEAWLADASRHSSPKSRPGSARTRR